MDEEKEIIKLKVPKFTKKFRENPWIVSTFVLIVLAIVLIVNGSSGNITGHISAGDAGQILMNFYEMSGAEELSLKSVEEMSGIYQVNFEYKGAIVSIYITKDGKFAGSMAPIIFDEPAPQEEYSEEDLEKISVFIDCLAEKGVKIYGANWCGWTKKLVVETLGGFDIAAPIYVECTENEELCSSEGITGYPTIKINGELYTGPRTFEGLSEATGCPAPEVAVQSNNPGQEASC